MAGIELINPLQSRDNFAQIEDQTSELVWETNPSRGPSRVTIAIPTYKRFDTLIEAIKSAAAQSDGPPADIIVVDNEGHGTKPEAVREALRNITPIRIRYFVNSSNLGMFGNWNRCIELCETEWLTILNDDDILRSAFLNKCFGVIDEVDEVDGIVCRKGTKDRRSDFLPIAEPPRRRIRATIDAALRRFAFRNGAIKISPKHLFFGNCLGNGAGFLFRRSAAIQLGGYDADESPSADFLFYIRMSIYGNLLLIDDELADVGIGDNESMNPDVLLKFISQLHEARLKMAGNVIPSGWEGMAPAIAAIHVLNTERLWGVNLDNSLVESELGIKLPPPNPRKIRFMQLRYGLVF